MFLCFMDVWSGSYYFFLFIKLGYRKFWIFCLSIRFCERKDGSRREGFWDRGCDIGLGNVW